MGSGYNKKRATGEQKALCAIRLDNHKDAKKSEERILLKVWKILNPKASIAMCSGEEDNIRLVKDRGTKEVKRGGGKMYQYHKKARGKLI